MSKPFDDVVERVLNESRQYKKTLDEIKVILNSNPKFQDMTVLGGIKAILKALHDEQEKSRALKKELEHIKSK